MTFSRGQIKDIKKRVKNGEIMSDIAKEFGVSRQTIHQIVHGLIYRKCGKPLNGNFSNRTSKLTKGDVVDIRRACCNGSNVNDLSKKYGVNKSTINNIIKRVTWKDAGGPEVGDDVRNKWSKYSKKLTEVEVENIKQKYVRLLNSGGFRNNRIYEVLADEFRVSKTTIRSICRGESHVSN